MGHLIAAAGAVEAGVCALAIQHRHAAGQREPARASIRTATSTSCATSPRQRRVRIALSNSLGFGGSNSCLAFRNPEEVDGRLAPADANGRRKRIVITGTRRDLRRRQVAGRDPRRAARGPVGDRTDRAVGRVALAGARSRPRSPTTTRRPRRRPQAAEAHPPHRRVRPLRSRTGDRRGRVDRRTATTLDAEAAPRRFNDATRRLRRLGRRRLPEPVRLLPAADGRRRQPARPSDASSARR